MAFGGISLRKGAPPKQHDEPHTISLAKDEGRATLLTEAS